MNNPNFNTILSEALAKQKRITNADRIRAMSDKELAQWFDDITGILMPWCNHPCPNGEDSICKDCITEWLKQEAK